ncbi:MAG: EAL domain-containing protein [Gemmatimonadota bacterium]|nr:EAL domain-containing protein [Gemmatimonadota bacterium]
MRPATAVLSETPTARLRTVPTTPLPHGGPLYGSLAASMERFAALAATALRAPIALIALVGEDRRCFAAGPTMPAWVAHDPGALRRSGLVDRVIGANGPVAISDIHLAIPPLHAEDAASLDIVGFVGVPLRSASGECLGIMCAGDAVPTDWTEEEIAILAGLAETVAGDLDLRQALAEGEAAERKLRHDATRDALTGLANRAALVSRLRAAVDRARAELPDESADDAPGSVEAPAEELVAVVLIDVDGFRSINERFGHHVGDQLLVAVGRRLEQEAGPGTLVARLGGDEFAVLLEPVTDLEIAEQIAGGLCDALTTSLVAGGQELSVTVSAGLSLSATVADLPEHLLRTADIAMARAKRDAQTRTGESVVIFDWRIGAEGRARRRLESELRRAVPAGEFVLHYLPTVHLVSGRIAGLEALLRWNHPTRGLLAPFEFLAVAEELGLISEIGRWVLREACRQVQEWNAELAPDAKLSVAVNLSARQFASVALIEEVARAVWDCGLDPSSLAVEVNERVVAQDVARAAGVLTALRTLGARVHLDDFGTGYSSLSCLQRLPLDVLKIDHSVVGRMDRDEQAQRVVRTVIGLARELGLETMAEGVSAAAHFKMLRELNCTYGQGPLFSSAIDPAGVTKLLWSERPW